MKARPRIQVILLISNLFVLLLPLGGIAVLRVYESALIRQTESELIAQAAFVSAAYRSALKQSFANAGKSLQELQNYGLLPQTMNSQDSEILEGEPWRPNPPKLDLAADTVWPKPEDGRTPPVAASALDILAGDAIMPIMRDAQVVTLAGIRVVDTQGVVVATTRSELGLSIMHRQEVSRALKGEHVSILRQRISDEPPPPLLSVRRGSVVRVFVAMPVYMQKRIVGAVVLSRSPRNIEHALYGKRYVIMYAAAAVFAVVLLLTLFTSFAINKPIKQLIIQAQRAVRGEKGAVQALQKPVTKEVEQLSNAIAKMAATLEHRADYFQNFAAHVSHAFKTPLTAIQGAVEILQDHFDDMPLEKKHKFLSNIADDSRRLDALVRRLFDLAKADTVQVGSQSTQVLQRLHELSRSHEFENLRITLPDKDDIRVNMESELFDSIVNTLLENAKQQSASEVRIDIDMQNNKLLSICFQDNGSGVSAANAERIFEPFFTTRANTGGTGLGLAVAKRLAIAHGGDLALRQHSGESGAVFCLTLAIDSVA